MCVLVLVTVLVKNLFIPALLLCFICSIYATVKQQLKLMLLAFPGSCGLQGKPPATVLFSRFLFNSKNLQAVIYHIVCILFL